MANRKILVPKYRFEHDTTAERLAYAYGVDDIGNVAIDMENGHSYLVTASGAGAGSNKNLTMGDQICLPLSLNDFREISSGSDVGNIAANGGILASDTTPILLGDAAESWEIQWAASNSDEIGTQISLPLNIDGTAMLDGTRNMYLITEVYGAGTTNAASFTVNTSWDGGAQVVDATDDSASKAITRHRVIATIAAADIPDSPKVMSLELVLGSHTTDVISLTGCWLVGYRK